MPRPPQLVEVEALNKVIKKVDDRFAEHARHLAAFRRLEGEVLLGRQIQAQRELADKFQALVVSYANAVIGFGYAGFFVTPQVGLGYEVFITGLFTHHHGNRRNVPIVRIANLACIVMIPTVLLAAPDEACRRYRRM
jgi:hypothetical protein